jgi:hypothetical protein
LAGSELSPVAVPVALCAPYTPTPLPSLPPPACSFLAPSKERSSDLRTAC